MYSEEGIKKKKEHTESMQNIFIILHILVLGLAASQICSSGATIDCI